MAGGEGVGARLRALRKERGLTLKQLARRAGISVSYLSDLERGRSRPSLQTLERLARALAVSRAALLGEETVAAPGPPAAAPGTFRYLADPDAGAVRLAAYSPADLDPAPAAGYPEEVRGAGVASADLPRATPGFPPPPELRELLADPRFGEEIGPRWTALLAALAWHAARVAGRRLSPRELLEAYLFLRRILGDLDGTGTEPERG